MPGIEKFTIVAGTELEKSVEQTLAENMYTLLDYYGNPDSVPVYHGMFITQRKTDPYFHGMDSSDRHHAFRLKAIPSFAAETPTDPITEPFGRMIVIGMDHGYSDDEDNEVMSEESFHWQPYVLLVVDAQDIDAPILLDAATGKELDFEDTMHLTAIITGMREAYRDEIFASDIQLKADEKNPLISYTPVQGGKFREFTPAADSSCRDCHEAGLFCFHQDGFQN